MGKVWQTLSICRRFSSKMNNERIQTWLSLSSDPIKITLPDGGVKAQEEKQTFERIVVTRDLALEIFSDNQFQVEIIKDLPEDKTIIVYRCGPLVHFCEGPHIPNTSVVKSLSCLETSSAYWRGNKDRESLQRVYGISYPDQKRLKDYKDMLEEAKKYDHRELTKKQKLFFFHPLSPGCFFLPRGMRVYNKLLDFMRDQYLARGYEEVENQEFRLEPEPMNFSGHCLIFCSRDWSYSELPLRIVDFGELRRERPNGAITDLRRVSGFPQDDAHIFCRESQVKDEVKGVLEFMSYVYGIFGFTFDLKLSTRPEKYIGDIETWDLTEKSLGKALNEFGKPWQINEADGAFYGPKIDITVTDSMRRKFQCATLQLDFHLPSRFNLTYLAEDKSKRERPVMIHVAILGSIDRMFAILLEHYEAKWPFWLSPMQAIVCPVSHKSRPYGLELLRRLRNAGFDVDMDRTDRTIEKKVEEAESAECNYILVVGEEESNTKQVSVRVRGDAAYALMNIDDLLQRFKDETLMTFSVFSKLVERMKFHISNDLDSIERMKDMDSK